MKTTTTLLLMVLTIMLVSCGKDNRSGSPVLRPIGNLPGQVPGGIVLQSLNAQQANSLNTVLAEQQCLSGTARVRADIPIDVNVALGQAYIGSTPEGDIAVVHNENGQPVFTAFVCERPDMGGNGNLGYQIVVNSSNNCAVDEITSATMWIESSAPGFPPYQLPFRPIYFDGSSLCSFQ